MKPTPKRLAWLKRLRIGPADRHSNVGYYCMTAGWTEWNYLDVHGAEITAAEAKERFGEQWWGHVTIKGERLTDAGRALLQEHCDHMDWDFKRHGRRCTCGALMVDFGD